MIPFVKAQGLGNDFVVLDALRDPPPADPPAFARLACDRRLGVGGDGLLLLDRGDAAPFRMRMWNPDGSESEMCGNGLRCAAALLRERGYAPGESVAIETGAGVLRARFVGEGVAVEMGTARLARGEIGMAGPPDESFVEADLDGRTATAVSMGNPHLVLFVPAVDAVDLEGEGSLLERHPLFPSRTNVHFAQVLAPGRVRVRVWERGAGATLACGTGACAVAVAGVETGRLAPDVVVELPGGPLSVRVDAARRVVMTGEARIVFEGRFGAGE